MSTTSPNADRGAKLPPLRDVIARHGLDAKKSLGQHFILDPAITARIAALAGDLTGRHVVEVGPGPGGLTRSLLATEATRILAVELDRRAIAAIEELRAHCPNLDVLEADATGRDLAALIPAPRQIVANLPYNIATPLLIGWLRQAEQWERLTLMFQLEVAERLCAPPATEHFGRLAVLAQWTCDVNLLLRLPPTVFTPPPKIWSAVVGLVPKPDQPSPALFRTMERLTAAAFGQRRKMLRGSLKSLGGETLLVKAGIAPDRRAETLAISEWNRLAHLLLGADGTAAPIKPAAAAL